MLLVAVPVEQATHDCEPWLGWLVPGPHKLQTETPEVFEKWPVWQLWQTVCADPVTNEPGEQSWQTLALLELSKLPEEQGRHTERPELLEK